MPVTTTSCPSCKTVLRVPDHMAGQDRLVKCPGCAHTFNLEKPAGEFEVVDEKGPAKEGFEVVDEGASKGDMKNRARDEDEDDRPRRKKKRSRGDDEHEEDGPPRRRTTARTKGRMSPGVWVALGVGGFLLLLLLVGGAVLLVRVASPRRLTDANIAKIKTGMSQKDVEKILGKGDQVSTVGLGAEFKTIHWEEGDTTLDVGFINDQVMSTTITRSGRR